MGIENLIWSIPITSGMRRILLNRVSVTRGTLCNRIAKLGKGVSKCAVAYIHTGVYNGVKSMTEHSGSITMQRLRL